MIPVFCNYPGMPTCVRLAEAYVPIQFYAQAYPLDIALDKGVLFPELFRPYFEERGGLYDVPPRTAEVTP
jgi:hypothetical protein